MKRVILFVLVLFCLPAAAVSQSPNAQAETLLRREMRERRIPGLQAAVVKDGKIVLLTSLGTADVQTATPVTNKSVFGIYSCTKAFTGVAIMQLVEDGKLDLSAPVSRYLEGLPNAWQPVTIRQLLTHVSGLPNILRALDPVTYGFASGSNEEASLDQDQSNADGIYARRTFQLQPNQLRTSREDHRQTQRPARSRHPELQTLTRTRSEEH